MVEKHWSKLSSSAFQSCEKINQNQKTPTSKSDFTMFSSKRTQNNVIKKLVKFLISFKLHILIKFGLSY